MREAREMGIPEEVIAQVEASAGEYDFEIWPDNWEALRAFLLVSTQWRAVPIGGGPVPLQLYWQGLDYGAVTAGLGAAGVTVTPDLWSDLRVIEAAARNALNGQSETDE